MDDMENSENSKKNRELIEENVQSEKNNELEKSNMINEKNKEHSRKPNSDAIVLDEDIVTRPRRRKKPTQLTADLQRMVDDKLLEEKQAWEMMPGNNNERASCKTT